MSTDGTVEALVGVIGRAHGIRGEVAVEPRTDEPERRFAAGRRLRTETDAPRRGVPAALTVGTVRDHSGRMIVRFEEVSDRTAAETLRGVRLLADVVEDERPSGDDEYFDRQLVGLAALVDGIEVGTVGAVIHLPHQDLLEIDTVAGARLVPFVQALVPEVDLAAGTVTIVDPGGLLVDLAQDEDPQDLG